MPPQRFAGVLVTEGEETGDGRLVDRGAIVWPDPDTETIPLMFQVESTHGAGLNAPLSRIAGRIERIFRDGDRIMAEGTFDTSPEGAEAARLLGDEMLTGVSIDPDDISMADVEFQCRAYDEDGFCIDELAIFHHMRIRGATMVPFQAILSARLHLVTDAGVDGAIAASVADIESLASDLVLLAAASVPEIPTVDLMVPPRDWYFPQRSDGTPGFDVLTPVTITPDGHVYGHLAPERLCLVGPNECRTVPHSTSGYSYFHTGSRLVSCCHDCDPQEIATGRVTVGGPHADRDPRVDAAAAIAHYEDVANVVADVRAGEDPHGVWIAGALRPDVTPEQVLALRGAALSGDWRPVNGRNELLMAHAVNMPGFPIPRAEAMVASGALTALIASTGIPVVVEDREEAPVAASAAELTVTLDDEAIERISAALEARVGARLEALETFVRPLQVQAIEDSLADLPRRRGPAFEAGAELARAAMRGRR